MKRFNWTDNECRRRWTQKSSYTGQWYHGFQTYLGGTVVAASGCINRVQHFIVLPSSVMDPLSVATSTSTLLGFLIHVSESYMPHLFSRERPEFPGFLSRWAHCANFSRSWSRRFSRSVLPSPSRCSQAFTMIVSKTCAKSCKELVTNQPLINPFQDSSGRSLRRNPPLTSGGRRHLRQKNSFCTFTAFKNAS